MNTNIHPTIDLKEAVRRLDSLPAMPIIAQKLLALKLDSDQDEQQMLLLIAQDPLISARIIGLANSPLFEKDQHGPRCVLVAGFEEGEIGCHRPCPDVANEQIGRASEYPRPVGTQYGHCLCDAGDCSRHAGKDAHQ
jgi:hypothetical protein